MRAVFFTSERNTRHGKIEKGTDCIADSRLPDPHPCTQIQYLLGGGLGVGT